MTMEEAFYNISMYLYNKNVLEYDQIAQSGPKSIIRNIKGCSNILDSPLNRENLGIKFCISVKLDIDVGLENAQIAWNETES